MDFDAAKNLKNDKLRRKLLDTLYFSRNAPRGGLSGGSLVDNVESNVGDGRGFESESHAMELIRDLANKKMAIIQSTSPSKLRLNSALFAPDHIFVRITDRGTMLIEKRIPPEPGIHDDRADDFEEGGEG